MNELKVKLTGINEKCIISIDNSPLKTKKNKQGSLESSYKTEKSKVELSVVKYLEINTKFWWLWQILYFVVSIFGIFDVPADNKCVVIEAKFNINLNERTEVTLQMNRQNTDNKAITVVTEAEFEEIKNTCYVDKKAKKKLRIIKAIKILTWIALVIVAIVLIVKKI